jgi:LysM repeat protein
MAEHAWRAGLARYGAPAAFLAAATIAALLIRAGLKGGNEKSSTPTAGTTTLTSTVTRPANPVYYRIRFGDTLGAVAERFHTSVDSLQTLNPGVDPNALRVGQKLRIK